MSAADIEIVREMYEAFNRGEYESATTMLHEDVTLEQWGAVPDSDTYLGREAFARGIARWVTGFEPGFQFRIDDATDCGQGVMLRVTIKGRGRASGAEVEERLFHVWELRDAKPYYCRVYRREDDARAQAGLEA